LEFECWFVVCIGKGCSYTVIGWSLNVIG